MPPTSEQPTEEPSKSNFLPSVIVVDVHEANAGLSKLIAEVEAGEQVVIAPAGNPVVELVLHRSGGVVFGTAAGRILIADDAFAWPDSEISQRSSADA